MFFIFKKKVKLFDTSSKDVAERREQILKKAGIRSNVWSTEAFPVIGGPHMKTADWAGSKPEFKDDQRVVWHLEVAQEDQYRAMKILMEQEPAQ
ncbi:MAG: hypothetical protein PUC46_06025 [Lachnospiraceae bacterium]|jgi:hypothetical protein|nr:hypothetical protein [Lachnospiraceae bacterium]